MDDKIVRTSVEENDSNIIKKQVMNKTDDSLIRHQVMGIGGDIPTPVYTTLSVTENNLLMSQTQNHILSTESSSATKSEYKLSSSCSLSVPAFQKRRPILVKLQLKKQLNRNIL